MCLQSLLCYQFSVPSICATATAKYFMRNKLFPWSFLNIATFNDGTFFLEFIFVRRNQCVLLNDGFKKHWIGIQHIVNIQHLYINFACLSVCLFVCLYPINVKTAEPIWPKFFVGTRVIPGKVYG